MSKLFNAVIILFTVSVITSSAYAGDVGNIASINVYPTTRSIVHSKGETVQGTYTALNTSGKSQHIFVIPRQWHMVEGNMAIPLESWFSISPREFDLEPGEKKEVVYNVTIPEDVKGELSTMIAFRPKPKEGQSVNVVFSVSLFVRVKEIEEIDCEVAQFDIWKYEDRKALGIKAVLKNNGNTHLKPVVDVHIQDLFNKTINKTGLKFGRSIYPGLTQAYNGAIYNFELKPGVYKAMIDISFTNLIERVRKKIYFTVGRNGKILFKLFKNRK